MAIVGERKNAARVFPAHPDQVGDPVHEHPGLARAGARQHQHVGQLAVIGHDPGLDRVAEVLDDGAPRGGACLAPQFRTPGGEPAVDEALALEGEVVSGKRLCRID